MGGERFSEEAWRREGIEIFVERLGVVLGSLLKGF